jgi:hypothetical protein
LSSRSTGIDACTNSKNRYKENWVLAAHLSQYARLELFWRVGREHPDDSLRDYDPRVVVFVDEVHCRAREPARRLVKIKNSRIQLDFMLGQKEAQTPV